MQWCVCSAVTCISQGTVPRFLNPSPSPTSPRISRWVVGVSGGIRWKVQLHWMRGGFSVCLRVHSNSWPWASHGNLPPPLALVVSFIKWAYDMLGPQKC